MIYSLFFSILIDKCLFIVFDIESFYTSILLDLFNKNIKFASTEQPIGDNETKKYKAIKRNIVALRK